jgi:nitrite reductase/ring-hydroxylating ferredoxin subunit
MLRSTALRFAERLRGELHVANGRAVPNDPEAQPYVVPASRYRDPARNQREREVVARLPRAVAASASLERGACLPIDLPGRPATVLLVRGQDGVVRAFANACRHRGTRLVNAPCSAKAFVCPYHAWTYDLTGKLVHVPHADSFPSVDLDARGLSPLPVSERHGLVWLGNDVEQHLGPADADVAALCLGEHVMWKRSQTTPRCNWKLLIEAFLDGYHIRVLHRDSVYRFFLDAASLAEPAGPHVRAVTGRRTLLDAPSDLTGVDVRQFVTPSLMLFPATIVVEHPDFTSIMMMEPVAANVTAWEHMMLVPAARAGETEHWTRSWQLIEEGVFQGQDVWVCEQAQKSIDGGAVDELLFGTLESPARWFHASLDAAVATS